MEGTLFKLHPTLQLSPSKEMNKQKKTSLFVHKLKLSNYPPKVVRGAGGGEELRIREFTGFTDNEII